jgi:hypothetical protein
MEPRRLKIKPRLKNGAEEAQKWSREGSKLTVETWRVLKAKPVVALSHRFDEQPDPDTEPHQSERYRLLRIRIKIDAYPHSCLWAFSTVKMSLSQ